jgi:phenylpropionate dioxygenase-like ring-hydroxylating dioxygenase large terminal subunit
MGTDISAETPQIEAVLRRLQANVERGLPDQADQPMKVPATAYTDAAQFQREIDEIFLAKPLLVALSCDIPEPGDFQAFEMVGRPIVVVRGDDGVARTFLNICRHRGARVTEQECGTARRFTCAYHSWSYDRSGALVGVPGRETFGEIGANALIELPTEEVVGAIFAVLDPQADIDARSWLGPMADALAELRLTELYPYRRVTKIDSPNWKLAADGYLDGYHIGYLHRNTIGLKSITNRNTYDMFGPHVRIGFATKQVAEYDQTPPERRYWPDFLSLVHYVFPNVSMSGGHGDTLQLSRLFPGPTPDRSLTTQQQYFRQPVVGDMVEVAETKRQVYEQVVRDEDCATIFGIGAALPALGDRHILFGRNEPANQHLHRCIAEYTAGRSS